MIDDYPILPSRKKRKRPPLDPDNKPWTEEDWEKSEIWPKPSRPIKYPHTETIYCHYCGWDSGIGVISHLVLYDDVICPNCKCIVIYVNRPTL